MLIFFFCICDLTYLNLFCSSFKEKIKAKLLRCKDPLETRMIFFHNCVGCFNFDFTLSMTSVDDLCWSHRVCLMVVFQIVGKLVI